ncbi:MAG: DUF167 domain-containing protein [Acidimicrobiales bacterium]
MAVSSSSDYLDVAEDGSLLLRLYVQPGAGRSAVVGRHGDALKVKVAPPASQGRSNEACVALVAASLGVKESAVELVSGPSSRAKRLRVRGLDAEDARRLLAVLTEARPAGAARPGNVGPPRNVR